MAPAPVTLVLPCWELRESYVECLREFQAEDPARPIAWGMLEDFQLYLNWAKQAREQKEIANGRAPQTTYWIVWEGKQAVGKLTLRHILTPFLDKLGGHFGYEVRPSFRRKGIASRALSLGLAEARKLGLTEVFVTCDDDNLGSIGTLERNSGQLLSTYRVEDWPKPVRKYRFEL